MKLSTRARYGTRALLDLARHEGERPVQLKEIAGRQDISLHYLEHIIAPLVGAGIVKSIRGARGGLQLIRHPEDVKLGEVIQLLEGAITPVDCIGDPASCERADLCVTRDIWCDVKKAIDATLDAVTLQDLVDKQKRKEAPRKQKT
ncbi:MAG: Rrf2 family transcriptional regulator [Dehalococcoidales bacterium]|nr:Rrf2 family transcriptional regulator [Dehalococcoidales bacterium]